MSGKTVTVFSVIADTAREGPRGDGTIIFRFREEAEAARFAEENTYYGRPATVRRDDDVPRKIAQRWGMA